jgi:hypothetical protein
MKSDRKPKKDKKEKSQKKCNPEDKLWVELKTAFVEHPELVEQIPQILASLDTGQTISTHAITDKGVRSFLEYFLSRLPVDGNAAVGWCWRGTSTRRFILDSLLHAKCIKQPATLDEAELISSRAIPVLWNILSTFAELKSDIKTILGILLDSGAIDVDNIDNEDVRDLLENFLIKLDLEKQEEGYSIPKGKKRSRIHDVVAHIQYSLKHFPKKLTTVLERNNIEDNILYAVGDLSTASGVGDTKIIGNPSVSSSSSDSLSSSSSGTSSGDDEEEKVGKRLLGPVAPSVMELRLAAQQQNKIAVDAIDDRAAELSDSASEDFGPTVQPKNYSNYYSQMPSITLMPLGYTGVSSTEATAANRLMGSDEAIDTVDAAQNPLASTIVAREEWMLTPGDSKHIAGWKMCTIAYYFSNNVFVHCFSSKRDYDYK